MNQLFIKKRANKYFILLFLLSFSNCLLANDSIPYKDFLSICKKSDAYLLYSYTDVSYSKLWSKYRKEVSVNNKLVVNNSSGVDKYAFLNLSNLIRNNLKEIKVKTLKADGTVVELDSSLVFQSKLKDKKSDLGSYPIPGVEPGDTIETSYIYYENIGSYERSATVSLFSNVPSFNTEYTIKTDPDSEVYYKQYNDFPEPQVVKNDTIIYCVFKMEKIIGISETRNSCVLCDLPHLSYSINDEDDELRTWKEVYNNEYNIITQPMALDNRQSSYYKKWKKKVIGKAKDSSKYYKLELLLKDLIDNVEIEPVVKREIFKSNGFFLKEKRFNPFSIRKLYRQLLEDLDIDYSAVFARSKLSGKIDPINIRNGEYDHILYAYDNGKESLNLLYPPEAYYKYRINEIPTSLYNTEAVILKPYHPKKIKKKDKFITWNLKLAEVDSVITNTIEIPGMSPDHNYMRQVYFCNVNLKEKETAFKNRFSVSGGLSTELRSYFSYLDQNKEASDFYDALSDFEGNESIMEIDTVRSRNLIDTSPFKYTISVEGKLNGGVTFLNDSIVSISLENLIKHNKIESEQESLELNYYLDYSYSDYILLMINFPCEIEVLGFDNKKEFANDYGEYFFELKIVDNKQIHLQSNYKILKDMIPKEEYEKVKMLNKIVKEVENKRLIVKLKNL